IEKALSSQLFMLGAGTSRRLGHRTEPRQRLCSAYGHTHEPRREVVAQLISRTKLVPNGHEDLDVDRELLTSLLEEDGDATTDCCEHDVVHGHAKAVRRRPHLAEGSVGDLHVSGTADRAVQRRGGSN